MYTGISQVIRALPAFALSVFLAAICFTVNVSAKENTPLSEQRNQQLKNLVQQSTILN